MSGIWLVPTGLILALLAVGPGGAFLGLLGPGLGFGLFLIAIAIAATSAIGLAGASAFASATGRSWRAQALRASIIPFLVVIPVVFATQRGGVPAMNDISTDLEDPPALSVDVAARADAPLTAELQTRVEAFAAMQRETYPEVQPLLVQEAADAAFERALASARGMSGWEVTTSDARAGRIEAIATSTLFRFKDDIAIRVRPEGSGARVDVRSRSRLGQSDLGANAERIMAYLAAYQGR